MKNRKKPKPIYEVILFDLDGVICDNEHRKHLVPPKDIQHKNDSWLDYINACDGDSVINSGLELYKSLLRSHFVLIVTSRQVVVRDKTLKWLEDKTGFQGNVVQFRPSDNHDSPRDFKAKVVDDLIDRNYNILFAVDDDPSVIDMYQSKGINTFQASTKCSSIK